MPVKPVNIPVTATTTQAQKAFDDLGKSADDLKKGLGDAGTAATGAKDDIDKALDEIDAAADAPIEKVGRLSGVFKNVGLALAGAGIIAGTVGFFASCVKDSLEASGKAAEFGKAMDKLKVLIGDVFLPAVTPLINFLVTIGEWFGRLDQPTRTVLVVLGLVIPVVVGLCLVLGPFITILGTLGITMGMLSAAAGPIALIILGIAAIIAIVILCIKYHEDIKKALIVAWDAIKLAFTTAWDAIKGVWNSMWQWLSDLPGKIIGIFSSAGTWLLDHGKAILQGLWDGLKWLWDMEVKGWLNITQKVKDAVGSLGTILWDAGKAVIQGLWGGMKEIWDKVWGWLSNIGSTVKNFFTGGAGTPNVPGSGIGSGSMGVPLYRAMGGPIPGVGPVPVIAHGGEYVLTKGDTSLMRELIAAVKGNGGGRSTTIYVQGDPGITAGQSIVAALQAAGVA